VPYGFGIVELAAERLRMIGRITEPDPSALTFGQTMRVVAATVPAGEPGEGEGGDDVVTWAFSPAAS
jgi:hypothetical protein